MNNKNLIFVSVTALSVLLLFIGVYILREREKRKD